LDLDTLVETLRKAGLTLELDKTGKATKAGLMVTRVQHGFLIHNLSADLRPRSLNKAQIAAVVKLFPAIEPLLSRNADTLRRVHFLEERYKSGTLSDFFTLDAGRPMPAPGSSSVNDPSKLPLIYGAIDDSNPNKPIVSLFGSEHGIKSHKLRPDEAMFSFEITKADADKIRAATNLDEVKDALKGMVATHARVLYYDDNRIINGEAAEKHALKSLATLEAWTLHILDEFKIKIRGELFIHVTEDLVLQPGVLVDEAGKASAFRPKTDFLPPGADVMTNHYSNTVLVEEVAGKVKVTRVAGQEMQKFSETLTKTNLNDLRKRAARVVAAIEAALLKIK
jgi:hypothetical protein